MHLLAIVELIWITMMRSREIRCPKCQRRLLKSRTIWIKRRTGSRQQMLQNRWDEFHHVLHYGVAVFWRTTPKSPCFFWNIKAGMSPRRLWWISKCIISNFTKLHFCIDVNRKQWRETNAIRSFSELGEKLSTLFVLFCLLFHAWNRYCGNSSPM